MGETIAVENRNPQNKFGGKTSPPHNAATRERGSELFFFES